MTAFQGGKGTGKGQFDNPRGLAVDSAGNIFVADTDNGRIEKFSPNGIFITSIGTRGEGYGQLKEPNGIAIDRAGNIYVAGDRLQSPCSEAGARRDVSLLSGKAPTRHSTGREGSPLVLTTRFMSSIRVALESLSSIPMVKVLDGLGQRRKWRWTVQQTLLRSLSIRRPTMFMSPIQLTDVYRSLTRMVSS